MRIVNRIVDRLSVAIDELLLKIKARATKSRLERYPNIHSSVTVGPAVQFLGPYESIAIGEYTYINDAIIAAGSKSKIVIGSRCAIGYRVSIKAVTHDVTNPCFNDGGEYHFIQSDIEIGDSCWIGDNVFIREGVSLGSHVVVGANSVVTKSFPDNVVIAGSPAAIIKNQAK
jgi:maltose O-acetyltransferase